ncbi:MAG: SDR family oxidoreductase [Chloroflexi bacterium]|nr:SDR family oxidoreductase [Chloroflexota bacterium]
MSVLALSLDKKVAILTGAGRGIGKTIAVRFAEAGADVVVCGRTEADLATTADEIRKLGRRSLAVICDTTVKAQVDNLVATTLQEFGTIDILVNNAGIQHFGPLLDYPESDWDKLMNTDLKGYFLCIQAVGRVMVPKKKGNIINLSSNSAAKVYPAFPAYCVAKAGVTMLTRVFAVELGPHNIRVNAIAPSLVRTEMNRHLWSNPDFQKLRISQTPLRRIAEPDDVAGAALYLASDISGFVTGHVVNVDGGIGL